MKKIKRMPFIMKIILTTTTLLLLVGIVLITSSIKIQRDVLTAEMENQAIKIAEQWGNEIDQGSVENASGDTDYNSNVQKEFISFLDNISATNPNVAQGYIFSSELQNGSQSSIISVPTHLIEALAEADIKIGDQYEHPPAIAKSIKELNETKEMTVSEIYEDPFGTWVTVLYPITNGSGEVSSFFAVDVDAGMVKTGTQQFLKNSLLILIPSILIIVLLQIIVIRNNAKPLKALLAGINEMRNGNLDIKLETREDDLGKMNEAFNQMAAEIKGMISKISETSTTVLQYAELVSDVTEQSKANSFKVSENIKQMTEGIRDRKSVV